MGDLVLLKVIFLAERFSAHVTAEWLLHLMCHLVTFQVVIPGERLHANIAVITSIHIVRLVMAAVTISVICLMAAVMHNE